MRTRAHAHSHTQTYPRRMVLITSSQISGYHTGYSCSYALLIGLRLAAQQMGGGGVQMGLGVWGGWEDVWGPRG